MKKVKPIKWAVQIWNYWIKEIYDWEKWIKDCTIEQSILLDILKEIKELK